MDEGVMLSFVVHFFFRFLCVQETVEQAFSTPRQEVELEWNFQGFFVTCYFLYLTHHSTTTWNCCFDNAWNLHVIWNGKITETTLILLRRLARMESIKSIGAMHVQRLMVGEQTCGPNEILMACLKRPASGASGSCSP